MSNPILEGEFVPALLQMLDDATKMVQSGQISIADGLLIKQSGKLCSAAIVQAERDCKAAEVARRADERLAVRIERMNKMAVLRESGKTLREIGDEFGINPARVHSLLSWRYGLIQYAARKSALAADGSAASEAAPCA